MIGRDENYTEFGLCLISFLLDLNELEFLQILNFQINKRMTQSDEKLQNHHKYHI